MNDHTKEKNFELNKIAASILLAGLIAMLSGFITNILYHPNEEAVEGEKRGYQISVSEENPGENSIAPVAETPIDVKALLAAADAGNGEKIANKCAACHSFGKGEGDKVGPNLWNVIGSKIASKDAYLYSDALKAKGGVWEYAELFKFLHGPKIYVPGTKMSFAGLKKPEEVADLLKFLRTKSDSPYPLP